MPSRNADNHRRAGRRSDELLPGESNEEAAGGSNAVGTPAGGLASGGLAGTNAADGSYDDDVLQEDAMSAGIYDHSGDKVDEGQAEGGISGGAAGRTPAGKRSGPRKHD
jgi:hypothetical protein